MQNQNSSELDALAEELTLRREVSKYGTICYYNSDGQLHRIHGPAVIYTNGTKEWYRNGKRHRIHGPAAIYPDGTRIWYQNGRLHRLDGPAVVFINGVGSWYVDDFCYTEQEFNAHPLVIAHRAKSAL